MKVLYLSSVTTDRLFSDLFATGATLGYVGQKYHGLFIKGLEHHFKDGDITVLSFPPTSKSCFVLKENQGKVKFRYVPIIPFGGLKQIISILYSIFYSFWWCLKNITERRVIVCSLMRIYQFAPLLLITNLFHCKKITVACDIPWMTITQVKVEEPSAKQKVMIKIGKALCHSFDGYVLLTESMNSILNIHNKPYVVVEGFCDISMKDNPCEFSSKMTQDVVLYAGGLNVKYGLGNLVDAVSKMNNVELWLYGVGDITSQLEKKCPANVKFMGPRSNAEVVEAETLATLLINPRPTDSEYTRYSFPSKTLEYMVSGTYTLSTKLGGIPDEYFNYCGCIEDESAEGIRDAINESLQLYREELYAKGLAARQFVLENKNNVMQTARVVELMRRLFL